MRGVGIDRLNQTPTTVYETLNRYQLTVFVVAKKRRLLSSEVFPSLYDFGRDQFSSILPIFLHKDISGSIRNRGQIVKFFVIFVILVVEISLASAYTAEQQTIAEGMNLSFQLGIAYQ